MPIVSKISLHLSRVMLKCPKVKLLFEPESNVCFGSKADIRDPCRQCPLYPRKRTSATAITVQTGQHLRFRVASGDGRYPTTCLFSPVAPTPLIPRGRGSVCSSSHGVRDAGSTLRFVGGQQRATTTASRGREKYFLDCDKYHIPHRAGVPCCERPRREPDRINP